MIPHLVTALQGPINQLEQRILDAMPTIEAWFREQWQEITPPFYTSIDIRNAGYKLAPVDTNLFPGGWNNLSNEMLPLAVQAAMVTIEKICPIARKLLLIPENHTRNPFYLQNIVQLQRIFQLAGLHVRLGSLNPEITAPTTINVPALDGGSQSLTLEPLLRNGNRLGLVDFDPCAILLNNDLSAGLPAILSGLDSQFLLPPPNAGWYVRRKSHHFACYQRVAQEFGALLEIDPWLIDPYFDHCQNVNFMTGEGLDTLRDKCQLLLQAIGRKYAEYGITDAPYVVIKADNGTYGMGIMMVRDVAELNALNRKTRNKMNVIKDGQTVSDVIIQEGVITHEQVNQAVAEPVAYLLDRYVVGGFYRVHAERDIDENLNAPGAHFVPLAFEQSALTPELDRKANSSIPNRFYMYGVIARLATLAASHELATPQ